MNYATEEQKSYLRGKRYQNEKAEWGDVNINNDNSRSSQNGNIVKTSERLADEYNVSKNTIIRDAEFAACVDKTAQELKDKILAGKAKGSKSWTLKWYKKG